MLQRAAEGENRAQEDGEAGILGAAVEKCGAKNKGRRREKTKAEATALFLVERTSWRRAAPPQRPKRCGDRVTHTHAAIPK